MDRVWIWLDQIVRVVSAALTNLIGYLKGAASNLPSLPDSFAGWRLPDVDWERYARVSPLLTAIVVLLAGWVALRALRAHRLMARRRAALDFFLRIELDSYMADAYHQYRSSLRNLIDPNLSNKDRDVAHKAVRTYLDVIELMAIAIDKDAFDEDVCYDFWNSMVQSAVMDGANVIRRAREADSGFSYEELIRLQQRWTRRAKRERRTATAI